MDKLISFTLNKKLCNFDKQITQGNKFDITTHKASKHAKITNVNQAINKSIS
jgi:hypothetical protein